ncbi:MAG: IclR family transcriptional regulator [Limnohabitans sp.]|nr:IclR family transcriptional regulator [Limnohabitans sp.]
MSAGLAPHDAPEGAQAIRRAMRILRAVVASQDGGARLVDLVSATELSRPTVHRILQVLMHEGAVEQDPSTRRYFAGPEIALMGLARGRRFPLLGIAQPNLRRVSEALGDTVFLSVRRGHDSIAIERLTGSYPLQVLAIAVGARRPLGSGVSGVAMLSALASEDARDLLAANATRLRLLGIATTRVQAEVALARRLGYAFKPQGVVPGTSAVSVPIALGDGAAQAALSVAAVSARLTRERLGEVVPFLQAQAADIAQRWQRSHRSARAVAT